ncbi:MAG: cation transporter [Methanosarcinales archaeon]|nr:cation transporter [Methanosarcinales archaeon]
MLRILPTCLKIINKILFPIIIMFFHPKTEYWQDRGDLRNANSHLSGYFKAITIELLERPMSHKEILQFVYHFKIRLGNLIDKEYTEIDLDEDITFAIEYDMIEEKNGKVFLTLRGREIAKFMQKIVNIVMDNFFSEKMVSIISISLLVLLSVLKIQFGMASDCAGLIADGINSMVGSLSYIFIWLGSTSALFGKYLIAPVIAVLAMIGLKKFDKEKIFALYYIILMFISFYAIAMASINKIMNPGPVEQSINIFIFSALCAFIMLILSIYQFESGMKLSNFMLMCRSIDSRNHCFMSLLICFVIVLSILAEIFNITWLYYGDAMASVIIGFLILCSALEMSFEFFKSRSERTIVSHFMGREEKKAQNKIIMRWIIGLLKETPLTKQQLEERFTQQFSKETPKVLIISGFCYNSKRCVDMSQYLDQLIKEKKLMLTLDNKYHFHKY